jgi:tRNA (guanine37-N1)-methyltransferase
MKSSRKPLRPRRPKLKSPKLRFQVVTLFPEALDSYLKASILKRAIEDGYVKVGTKNPRDFTDDPGRRVDRKPYGGGPGMVMEALPVARAIAAAKKGKPKAKVVWFSPSGQPLTNELARKYAAAKDIVLVCGRYEGIDARVKAMFKVDEVSVGPYVLTGGELPALTLIDAAIRHVPGVLGDDLSVEESRAASADAYTRPVSVKWKGKTYSVPEILLSGHHAKIDGFRSEKPGGAKPK